VRVKATVFELVEFLRPAFKKKKKKKKKKK
jgi:hypothetical protein